MDISQTFRDIEDKQMTPQQFMRLLQERFQAIPKDVYKLFVHAYRAKMEVEIQKLLFVHFEPAQEPDEGKESDSRCCC